MSTRKLRFWRAASVALLPCVRGGHGERSGSRHVAEGVLRPQHRRRLLPRQLRPVHGVLEEDRRASPTGCRSSRSASRRKAGRSSPRSSRRRRTSSCCEATRTSRMQLAKGEGLTDAQAHALAKEGKAVVWFDGGLHATEVARREPAHRDDLPAHQPQRRGDAAHPAATTSSSPCTRIRTACSSSPNWYMKDKDTLQREHEHSAPLQQIRGPRRQSRLRSCRT